jgi:DNA invertase Pin-like site-specific DNA recombinase
MTVYGYARVSTDGQTLDAQVAALKAAGAEKVFSEKQSGAKNASFASHGASQTRTDRAALARVLAALESGDVLVMPGRPRLELAAPRGLRAPSWMRWRPRDGESR